VLGLLAECVKCRFAGAWSTSSDGKTSSAGTPSPNLLVNLSIFAQRRLASEEISKLGACGGPNAANEIVFGLFRCDLEELSLATISNAGDPGIVSSVGFTDATADGGPSATVLEVSRSKGGGLRIGLRTRHESAELMLSV
jgi:hypothetical protein